MFLLLLAAQAAAASPAPPVPERFSILMPVGDEPCRPAPGAPPARPGDVTVCADALPAQAVPLPNDYVYDSARPSNPDLTGKAALAAQATPCATLQGGCQVGFGAPVVQALMGAAVNAIKDATRKRYPKEGRVAIPLDDPVPARPAAAVTPGSASTSARPSGSANP